MAQLVPRKKAWEHLGEIKTIYCLISGLHNKCGEVLRLGKKRNPPLRTMNINYWGSGLGDEMIGPTFTD